NRWIVVDCVKLLPPADEASNQRKRTAVLQVLPWYLGENPSKFIKTCEPTDCEDHLIKGMTIGIQAVVEDVKEPLPALGSDVVLVMEEHVVLRQLGDVPNALMNLMGLLYALNMDYPKDLKYTFEVIQRLFVGIGMESCTARVQTLRNELLS
ncbi:hypothetical protein MHYP_G00017250, partial [Metynnis hypsauchen]